MHAAPEAAKGEVMRGTLTDCAADFFAGSAMDGPAVRREVSMMSATQRDDLAHWLQAEGYDVTDRRGPSAEIDADV
jgi:hypothetical protein